MEKVKSRQHTQFWQRSVALGSALTLTATMVGCNTASPGSSAAENSKMPGAQVAATEKPNIVYIMLDDLGYSDLGCYGSTISTPNIDKLVQSGILYNNYFTTPLSSPSRAALLTGNDPNLVGMGTVADVDMGTVVPNIRSRVYPQYGTVANTLSQNGYDTMAVGKWHLGPFGEFTPDGDRTYWPSKMGFEQHYVFAGGQTSQFSPSALIENDQFIEADFSAGDYHFTNDMVDTSLEFIDNAKTKGENPFFLYFATGAMHAPLQVDESYIAKYQGKFDAGWDVEREKRFENQKNLGLFAQDTVITERDPEVPAWDSLSDMEKAVAIKHMEVYAGFLDHTDEQIGRLISEIKARGEYDDTIFVLISDNGGNPAGLNEGNPMSHAVENNVLMSTEDQYAIVDQLGTDQYGGLYNTGWANASNTPFRLYKQTAFYGGIRSPLIVSWVSGIKEPGRMNSDTVMVTDISPTMLDVTGIPQATEVNGIKQEKMQGISFKETLESSGARKSPRTELFIMMFNQMTYMDESNYMITFSPQTKWELFDTAKDPMQVNNLIKEHPEKFAELYAKFEETKKKNNAQNLIMDVGQGVKPEVILERYGDTAKAVYGAMEDGIPPTGDAVELVKILQSLTFKVPGGRSGDGVRLYQNPEGRQSDYSYKQEDGIFYSLASAHVASVSHTISTTIETNGKDDKGVIVANGANTGGYTLYVKNNKLFYESNFCNDRYVLESSKPVPAGKADVSFEYQKTGLLTGRGMLKINGETVAEKDIKTLPVHTANDYFSIGEDAGSLTSNAYTDKFAFTGKVGEIKIHVEDDIFKNMG